MKKILITQSNLTVGGIQKALINLLSKIDYKKYEVDLVLFEKKGDFLSLIPQEVTVVSIADKYNLSLTKFNRIIIETFFSKKYFKRLYKKLVEEKEYDIAIAFDGYVDFADYYAAFSKAKKKYIWVHSDYYFRKKYQLVFKLKLLSMKKKYKMFDKIFAVSESAMNSFGKVYPEYKNKLDYIWNFIDIPNENIQKEESNIVLDKKIYNIISVGSLRKVKGFDRLIEIQRMLIANGFNTKVYIVGDGPDRKKLEKIIDMYDMKDSFILLGQFKNIYSILNQADLFVTSSYYEGFGVALLESLYCNVPILVPKISGAYDVAKYIAPKGSAMIVENSVEGLYKGIVDYMTGPKLKFSFKIEDYNAQILKQLEKKILK